MEHTVVIWKVTQPTGGPEWIIQNQCKNLLNAALKREYYILLAIDQTLTMMSDAKVFTKLYAQTGFWIPLIMPESWPLTTFISLFGRYLFNGLLWALHRLLTISKKDVEDFEQNRQEHDQRLRCVLQQMQEEGITLKREMQVCEGAHNLCLS